MVLLKDKEQHYLKAFQKFADKTLGLLLDGVVSSLSFSR